MPRRDGNTPKKKPAKKTLPQQPAPPEPKVPAKKSDGRKHK